MAGRTQPFLAQSQIVAAGLAIDSIIAPHRSQGGVRLVPPERRSAGAAIVRPVFGVPCATVT